MPMEDIKDLHDLLINIRRAMRTHIGSLQHHPALLIDLRFAVKNLGVEVAGLQITTPDTTGLRNDVSRIESTVKQIEHDVTAVKTDVEIFKVRLDLVLSRLPEQ